MIRSNGGRKLGSRSRRTRLRIARLQLFVFVARPRGTPAIRPTRDTSKAANENGGLAVRSAMTMRWLSYRLGNSCHSGPKALNPRGLGTESPTGTGTLPNGDFDGRNRPSSGLGSLAGFWVSPIGRIEASPEGPLPFEPSPVNATPSGLIAKSWSRVVGQNYQTGTSTCETLF